MDPINGLTAIAEILRRRAVDSQNDAGKTGKTAPATAGARATVTLEQKIRVRLAQIGDVKGNARRFGQAAIAEILVEEFGGAASNETKFIALVSRVYEHIECDPDLKDSFEEFIKNLSK